MGLVNLVRQRSATISDAFLTRLWPLPSLGVGIALVVAVAMTHLDAQVDSRLPSAVLTYIFQGDADAARSVLSSIAGSLITVTSLTFSLTVVTLQLASSQFSPRLLRTFTGDRFVQSTLTLFLFTFVYALTVLRAVRSGSNEDVDYVPRLSVTLGYLLTVASALGLVLFLAHLVRQIRVETLLSTVSRESRETFRRVMPEDDTDSRSAEPEAPTDAALLTCETSGFVIAVDAESLLAAAASHEAVVRVESGPGSVQVAGTPVARAWSTSAEPLAGERLAELRRRFASAVKIGRERTALQDVGYGLRQVTDVTARALSPGINDPTTAVHAIATSAALLCDIAGRNPGPRLVRDDEGQVRLVITHPGLAELLDLAIAQPRRYGAADPAVLAAIFSLLRQLAWLVETEADRGAVREQLRRLRGTVGAQDFDEVESARLQHQSNQVEEALDGRWPEG